jgi:hypothetical protein
MKKLATLLLTGLLLPVMGVASPLMDRTLTMTIVNHTTETLNFINVTNQNPGNIFSVTPASIPPQATAVVTGTITEDFDLAGLFNFTDNYGHPATFFLLDPRNFHSVEPDFFQSQRYNTIVEATLKGDNAPRGLYIRGALVDLQEASGQP